MPGSAAFRLTAVPGKMPFAEDLLMKDTAEPRWLTRAAIGLSLAIATSLAADLREDFASGLVTAGHFVLHGVIMMLALVHAGVMWWRIRAQGRRVLALGLDVAAAVREAERWKAEAGGALGRLRAAMDAQMARWNLTEAEHQIALLILKGLSHKEIADVRQTSERTVRQQALAVYRKSGLSGRHALSAFFLDDLFTVTELQSGARQPQMLAGPRASVR